MQPLSLRLFSFTQARTSIICALVCVAVLTGCYDATDPTVPVVFPTAPTSASPPLPPTSEPIGNIAGFVIGESDPVHHGSARGDDRWA